MASSSSPRGLGHGCALLAFDEGEAKVVWESKAVASKMSGCVQIGEHLYGFDERNMLKCVDLEGQEVWRERLDLGSVTGAGERLIVISGDGELIISAANPEKYEELSRAKVLEGGVCWTPPVLAGGRIFCRNSLGHLVCRDHRAAD